MSVKRGSILAETVLVMPLLLLLIFGIIQFAFIWTAKQMTAYAAYCAARAMVVSAPQEQPSAAIKAAELALSTMSLSDDGNGDEIVIPGWGRIYGSGFVRGRSRVTIGLGDILSSGDVRPFVAVRVNFDFPLMIPGMAVNRIVANSPNANTLSGDADFYDDLSRSSGDPALLGGWPYIRLSEVCALPMPYSTANFPTNAFSDITIRLAGGISTVTGS